MDGLTGVIGAILMITFLVLIAAKLNQLALWIVCIVGIALMLWAVWTDGFAPMFKRSGNGK